MTCYKLVKDFKFLSSNLYKHLKIDSGLFSKTKVSQTLKCTQLFSSKREETSTTLVNYKREEKTKNLKHEMENILTKCQPKSCWD